MVPSSLGWGSAVLATSAILAPSAAAFLAMARPMPRLAPEMNMVLPDKDMPSTLCGHYPAAARHAAFTRARRHGGGRRRLRLGADVGDGGPREPDQIPGRHGDVQPPLARAAQHTVPGERRAVENRGQLLALAQR